MPIGFPQGQGAPLFAPGILWGQIAFPTFKSTAFSVVTGTGYVAGSRYGQGDDIFAWYEAGATRRGYCFNVDTGEYNFELDLTVGIDTTNQNTKTFRSARGNFFFPIAASAGEQGRICRVNANGTESIITLPGANNNVIINIDYLPESERIFAQYIAGGVVTSALSDDDGDNWTNVPMPIGTSDFVGVFELGGEIYGINNNLLGNARIWRATPMGWVMVLDDFILHTIQSVYHIQSTGTTLFFNYTSVNPADRIVRSTNLITTGVVDTPLIRWPTNSANYNIFGCGRLPDGKLAAFMNAFIPLISSNDGQSFALGQLVAGPSELPYAGAAQTVNRSRSVITTQSGRVLWVPATQSGMAIANLS